MLLMAASCSFGTSGSTGADDVPVPSAHELATRAYEAARVWRSDAHLIFIDLEVRPRAGATFSFNSMSHPETGLNVHIDDPLGTPSLRPVEVDASARKQTLPSIDEYANGPVDSIEAFKIALESGGRGYIQGHPEVWEDPWLWNVNLQYLNVNETPTVVWRVYFTNLLTDGYEVLVDPLTGKVLEITEGP